MMPDAPSPATARRKERSLALRYLGRVSLRTAGLGRTAALVTAGALPLIVTVARGHSDLGGAITMLALVAGASFGGVADDPTADLLAPCPIPASTRIAARLVVTLATVAGCVAAALVIGALGPGLPDGVADLLAEFAVASTMGVAVGLSVHRRGEPYGALSGITAGVMGPLTVAAFGFRWPTVFPMLGSGPTHQRWWYLAAAAFAVACHAGRDVGRPSMLSRLKGNSI